MTGTIETMTEAELTLAEAQLVVEYDEALAVRNDDRTRENIDRLAEVSQRLSDLRGFWRGVREAVLAEAMADQPAPDGAPLTFEGK